MDDTNSREAQPVAGPVERTVRPGAVENLRDAVLTLNYLWNTSQDEAVIANQLDLCRRLAKYMPQGEEDHMAMVLAHDANNYCRVLTALGMEEEGDPVAEVERMKRMLENYQAAYSALRDRASELAQVCTEVNDHTPESWRRAVLRIGNAATILLRPNAAVTGQGGCSE